MCPMIMQPLAALRNVTANLFSTSKIGVNCQRVGDSGSAPHVHDVLFVIATRLLQPPLSSNALCVFMRRCCGDCDCCIDSISLLAHQRVVLLFPTPTLLTWGSHLDRLAFMVGACLCSAVLVYPNKPHSPVDFIAERGTRGRSCTAGWPVYSVLLYSPSPDLCAWVFLSPSSLLSLFSLPANLHCKTIIAPFRVLRACGDRATFLRKSLATARTASVTSHGRSSGTHGLPHPTTPLPVTTCSRSHDWSLLDRRRPRSPQHLPRVVGATVVEAATAERHSGLTSPTPLPIVHRHRRRRLLLLLLPLWLP